MTFYSLMIDLNGFCFAYQFVRRMWPAFVRNQWPAMFGEFTSGSSNVPDSCLYVELPEHKWYHFQQ